MKNRNSGLFLVNDLHLPPQKKPTITFIEHMFQNILRRKEKLYKGNFFFDKMLEFFSKIVEKYNQNIFFIRFQ